MKWRPIKTRPLTNEEMIKNALKDRIIWKTFDSERESDRHWMEQALNYIERLESQLSTPRDPGPQQPSNELKLRRIKKMLTAFVTIVHVSPHIQDEKFRDCVKDVLTGTVEELSELELPST
jgi:hypothetical protein